MCSSKSKFVQPTETNDKAAPAAAIVLDINGRLVLQPATSNRGLMRSSHYKKNPPLAKSITTVPVPTSPKQKSPRQPAKKQGGNEQCTTTKNVIPGKKLRKSMSIHGRNTNPTSLVVKYSSEAIVNAPGSIAAAWREQVAVMQDHRKMKIAHYGRSVKSAKNHRSLIYNVTEEKRCSFITPYSDPIYVAYHDEDWGVPVHDDKLLFELLVLTSAQVGSDWTSVLNKRQLFREAFLEYEAETVSELTDIKITAISSSYIIDVGFIRGVVDNSKCILKIKKEFGSLDKYIWEFVNHKPIATNYKVNQKMPVKTSKSEAISKDMVKRGFRQVGPTVIHSFMQAAGLTNDHLTTCSRRNICAALAPRIPLPSSTVI